MHWLHSAAQLIQQIGSACQTYDEYYRVLCELKEDRLLALVGANSEYHRNNSTLQYSEGIIKSEDDGIVDKLKAMAHSIQSQCRNVMGAPVVAAAKVELRIIERLIELIEPYRAFKSLPDVVAHQKAQFVESPAALIWQGYIETKTYGTRSPETTSQLEFSGYSDFPFQECQSRLTFIKAISEFLKVPHGMFISPDGLRVLAETVNLELVEWDEVELQQVAYTATNDQTILSLAESSAGHFNSTKLVPKQKEIINELPRIG